MAKTNFVSNRVENVGSTLITITEDKLRNILLKHVPKIRKSRDWIGALFTTGSLGATIYACSFENKLGLKAELWEAIFIVLLFFGIVFLLFSFLNSINNKSDEETVIEEIKKIDDNSCKREHYSYGIKIENKKLFFFKEKISGKEQDN